MRSKSIYEKPESELLTLRTEWDFLFSANSENLTEEKGRWSIIEEEDLI